MKLVGSGSEGADEEGGEECEATMHHDVRFRKELKVEGSDFAGEFIRNFGAMINESPVHATCGNNGEPSSLHSSGSQAAQRLSAELTRWHVPDRACEPSAT
jgi:hypothetical protein